MKKIIPVKKAAIAALSGLISLAPTPARAEITPEVLWAIAHNIESYTTKHISDKKRGLPADSIRTHWENAIGETDIFGSPNTPQFLGVDTTGKRIVFDLHAQRKQGFAIESDPKGNAVESIRTQGIYNPDSLKTPLRKWLETVVGETCENAQVGGLKVERVRAAISSQRRPGETGDTLGIPHAARPLIRVTFEVNARGVPGRTQGERPVGKWFQPQELYKIEYFIEPKRPQPKRESERKA